MKFIKKQIAKIMVDELSEPNVLVKFIGLTFIVFGVMFIFDLISISNQFLMCIALAGVFFVISDISQHYYDSYSTKKALPIKHRFRVRLLCKVLKFVSLFFAIFSIVAGPYILLPFTNSSIEKFATTITVLAIGLTIFNISLNNTKKQLEFYESIANDYENLYQELQEVEQVRNEEK
ncbi:hypothetical protein [Lysinibacillus fusiformis]|uniref:hypothetical protein n=1 Tax=Lysinibacillus TaxID=400634 RepID=UPI003CEB6E62